MSLCCNVDRSAARLCCLARFMPFKGKPRPLAFFNPSLYARSWTQTPAFDYHFNVNNACFKKKQKKTPCECPGTKLEGEEDKPGRPCAGAFFFTQLGPIGSVDG